MMRKLIFISATLFALASCNNEPEPYEPYVLKQPDVTFDAPSAECTAMVNTLFKISVTSVSDEGVSYEWSLDGNPLAKTKNLEHMFETGGQYSIALRAQQGDIGFDYKFTVTVAFPPLTPPAEGATAYITKVLDYMPAVGQFTNKLPVYAEGDTQEAMNEKVLKSLGNNKRGMISLGGFGGYVTVGFDHTIANVAGKRDFRVLGNAFYTPYSEDGWYDGGSCEPGVIMVAYDANKNGVPDDNEWYEIAGSSHENPRGEPWYKWAKEKGNIAETIFNYQITYHRPEKEPASQEEFSTYIRWEDNQGKSGYKVKNEYHRQCYYPLWAGDKITFRGTCLPQNGIDEKAPEDENSYFVLYKFLYGYADNATNTEDESAIDIDWAVNAKGQKVNLPGVDFVKIYTGVNQENGWLGECSTEISGVEDLHILGVDIDTRK